MKKRGDAAVREYSEKFDRWVPRKLDRKEIEAILARVPASTLDDIRFAQAQIRSFAEHQRAAIRDIEVETLPGVKLGHRNIPVESVGCYVPGGRYPLPSSLLMTAIPARVAGVPEVIVCTPSVDPVVLAAAVEAVECEIYTDVAGVFTADPRIVPDARKLDFISFEEMLEMSASGAGVLQLRSVEYARNHGVRVHCRSSFDDEPGTVVVSEQETMEHPLITAVTHSTGEARVTLMGVPDTPGAAGRIATTLAEANVNVDMIIQNEPVSEGSRADMSFTVPRDDARTASEALAPLVAELGIEGVATDEAMGKVSIVGAGMKTHPGVAAKVFTVLGDQGINIEMISTSPIKISCVIAGDRVPDAVRALHSAFELQGDDTIRPEQPFGEFAS